MIPKTIKTNDVEKLAIDFYRYKDDAKAGLKYCTDSWIDGYKAAKQKGCFTEEDMIEFASHSKPSISYSEQLDNYKKSLKQPEWEFEIEMEKIHHDDEGFTTNQNLSSDWTETKPKIINNKIQGKWIKK